MLTNLLSIVLSLKIPENIYVRLCYHFQITNLGVLAETSEEKKHFMIKIQGTYTKILLAKIKPYCLIEYLGY